VAELYGRRISTVLTTDTNVQLALTADEIAKEADFFCFGTNDLTQMTFGFSRDDAGSQALHSNRDVPS